MTLHQRKLGLHSAGGLDSASVEKSLVEAPNGQSLKISKNMYKGHSAQNSLQSFDACLSATYVASGCHTLDTRCAKPRTMPRRKVYAE